MTFSYNGWPASQSKTTIGINPDAVAYGTAVKFPGGVKHGDVETVLMYVAGEIHRRVQKLGAGCWGFAYRKNRNADNLSCHASGTAIDVNAPLHPNGRKGTWTAAQTRVIRQILAEAGGVVRWGEDFGGTTDGMHFEIHADAAAVKRAAANITAQRHKPVTPPAKPPVRRLPTWYRRVLSLGSIGPDVRQMQARLHVTADGHFGPKTLAAVRNVQHTHKLTVDGVVGPQTAKVIG
jgi:murein L,D-transpeptidase YcbB/YkuD